ERVDAMLRELSVAAHVPFAHGAARAGHGIRMPHNSGDELTDSQAAIDGSFFDASERFVPNDQPLVARRCGTVPGLDDVSVCSANTQGNGAYENRAALRRRHTEILELQGVGNTGLNGEGAHRGLNLH